MMTDLRGPFDGGGINLDAQAGSDKSGDITVLVGEDRRVDEIFEQT